MNEFLVCQTRVFASVVSVPLRCAKVLQPCPALCDPVNHSLPGSSVHGTLQARILEWVAFPFSRGLSSPGIEPMSPTLQANSLLAESQWKPNNKQLPNPAPYLLKVLKIIRGVKLHDSS